MLDRKYSYVEDILMIAQAWKLTDMKEIDNMISTFSEIIHTV